MKVVLIAVTSLDGRITPPGQSGPGFASAADQAWFPACLRHFDCSVMGRATWEQIPREPGAPAAHAARLRMVMTRTPEVHAARARPGALEFSDAAPADIVGALAGRGFARCALLGGGQIYRAFLDAGLVDALWLTLEPVVLGGGTPLADGPVRNGRFRLVETRALSADTLLLNYRRPDAAAVPLPSPDTLS